MLRRKLLQVRPVRRYAEPGYPAAEDFQGFAKGPSGWGHPLRPSMLASALVATAAGGACGPPPAAPPSGGPEPGPVVDTAHGPGGAASATSSGEPAPSPTGPGTTPSPAGSPLEPIDQKALLADKGPFSWTAGELPIEWMPYGTGAPARLSEEQVRQQVERMFASAGIALRRNVPFARPGIAVELDGYDEDKKIGYEFVYWPDLEDPEGYPRRNEGDPRKMVSHEEMQRIMQRERQGAEHIAIISYQDSRLSYPGMTIPGGQAPSATEATALAALKQQLGRYIAWLRSQGAL